jgi:hypothetical protein
MSLTVDAQPLGIKLHRLAISNDGLFIGEYERSQAADIQRKIEEIKCALPLLLHVFLRKGEFVVRWDSKRRLKSIRVNGVEVGQVPVRCWRTPSWET